jgi:hypothetical protein
LSPDATYPGSNAVPNPVILPGGSEQLADWVRQASKLAWEKL